MENKKDAVKNKLSKAGIIGIVLLAIVVIVAVVMLIIKLTHMYRFVKIEEYEGEVSLERKDNDEEIFEGITLIPEDQVTTGDDGFVELLVDTDKHIGASENTRFTINAVGNERKGSVSIELDYGTALFTIDNKLEDDDSFKVRTPNATLSVRGTIFKVMYDKERDLTYVEVIEGRVWVSGKDDNVVLEEGERAVVYEDTLVLHDSQIDDYMSVYEIAEAVDEKEADDTSEAVAEEAVAEYAVTTNSNGDVDSDLAAASVGDIVNFGYFEEVTEWIVLDKQEDMVLLITKYSLDEVSYADSDDSTWQDSNVRYMLNNVYYDAMFNEEEARLIADVTLTNPATDEYFHLYHPSGAGYSDFDGPVTTDKMFLLSWKDLEKYYGVSYDPQTGWPRFEGAEATYRWGTDSYWWIRANANSFLNPMINYDGNIAWERSENRIGIRPVIVVMLNGETTYDMTDPDDIVEETPVTEYDGTVAGTYNNVPLDPGNGSEVIIRDLGDGTVSVDVHIWRIQGADGMIGTVDEAGNIEFTGEVDGILTRHGDYYDLEFTSTKGYLEKGQVYKDFLRL